MTLESAEQSQAAHRLVMQLLMLPVRTMALGIH